MHFSFKGFVLGLGLILFGALSINVLGQTPPGATPSGTPSATPTGTPGPAIQPTPEKQPKPDKNAPAVPITAEQVAEATILIYGSRNANNQIKRTTLEHGKLTATYPDGSTDNATYDKRVIRGENTEKDKWRLDQKFPSVEYSMIYNAKIFGILGGSPFTPRQEVVNGFEAQIWHSFDALMRYKENGSKLELSEKQKNMGVEYYVLDVIDKNERRTRFFISVRSLRIMSLEYEMNAVKYVRKFYDYRLAQGLLVPYRTVLWTNDKQTEESRISTVTYGQKVEESIFSES